MTFLIWDQVWFLTEFFIGSGFFFWLLLKKNLKYEAEEIRDMIKTEVNFYHMKNTQCLTGLWKVRQKKVKPTMRGVFLVFSNRLFIPRLGCSIFVPYLLILFGEGESKLNAARERRNAIWQSEQILGLLAGNPANSEGVSLSRFSPKHDFRQWSVHPDKSRNAACRECFEHSLILLSCLVPFRKEELRIENFYGLR